MKKDLFLTLLVALFATLTFTGCKEDITDSELGNYEVLTTYLKSNNLDISTVTSGFVMPAPADGNLSAKWIMDIRSAADFATAHIAGAHNVPFADILTTAATADKPILVVCYTGQTACYATSLLRLYGFSDAQALKWGMSGWNSQFDKWTANCKDLTTESNWTSTATEAGSFDMPSWTSPTIDGASLLKERVEAAVAAGFKTAAGADVLASPDSYYVNNFLSEAHYTGFGHVKNAVRVNPLSIDECAKLDPNAKVVTYCYTGQTSAVVTAYLNVLGFEAYSMTFGLNGVTTSNPFWTSGNVSNHWGHDSKSKDLPTVSN
ncbi:rhodanese-like domain-containing protein [Maribellus sp. CM-23]|uniref:rhodanese-like domain-containing protein n=1 Tax=Maribellus sp. CM-23 TaxID=2781026 RepID=UPI001F334FD1|nr:rhodanese-like domain-containing protein [Maribellus sp. CM-23]MCE4563620.1 rhodanese-like domain-containing protein [Maribellus sp. CM-23]